ncbi:MAG: aldo/keto reductase [Bacilli bacterium]
MKKLGFGCMRLPLINEKDETSIDESMFSKMVDHFLEEGFTYFDTAYMYHEFKSELYVKKCLVERHKRDEFLLADKLPIIYLEKVGDQERFFDEQLQKTGATYFDYYLLHNLNSNTYPKAVKFDSFAFCLGKKHEGKIKNLGFSFHDSPELLEEILTAHPEVDFVQLQINYIDWESANIQSRKCYEVASKHNKKVIVMEPIKGGGLVALPESALKIYKDYNPDISIASWAIRFAASLPNVFMVLSGMSNYDQLLDNTSYMKDFKVLNSNESKCIDEVVAILNKNNIIACTKCRYCIEGCVKSIPIPDYFALYNEEKKSLNKLFSTHGMYYRNLAATHGKASECIACHKCEKSCPQHLHIVDLLKEVARVFEEE